MPKSYNQIILLTAAWLTMLTNASYFRQVLSLYQINLETLGFVISIVVLQFSFVVLVLCLFSAKYLFKPWILLMTVSAASAAYFMDSFGLVIDQDMIRNILQTNTQEALDLVSFKLLVYLVLLGLLPVVWVTLTPTRIRPFWLEILSRVKLIGFAIVLILLCITIFFKPYASFFREHKSVRFYSNPVYPLYSSTKYLLEMFESPNTELEKIGLGAHIPANDIDRELIIFVIGETVRADHFSLNDYSRNTNPRLAQESLFNFSSMTSCATSTAVSVPCIFSLLPKKDFSTTAAGNTENLLDVLKRAGVNVLWRDNNSNSKGVADRVEYQNFRDPSLNSNCDIECRDEGMLIGLTEYINAHPSGDILIVLHQMGNHGPAYYKRYPAQFETFTPACKTAQLENCSDQEIINAYDNAILYTDYFLSKTIKFLNEKSDQFETGLIYASDHGESLGEKGIYLHGLPDLLAPPEQTNVASFLWLGESYEHANRQLVLKKSSLPLSHDNLFHTLLGLFEIDTVEYQANLDVLSDSW
ncbi:MAG: phosphoethanolamine--lipid A transferase [Gammaproteobacteria bacterium]|nr:phosphoethanolamine--lipid A transferase [Gammaproteobacteria bacterium]